MLAELTFARASDLLAQLSIPHGASEEAPHLAGDSVGACEATLLASGEEAQLALVRAYFQAPEQLSDDERGAIARHAPAWLTAIGGAALTSVAELIAEMREGPGSFSPPREFTTLTGYRYLGSFLCTGGLTVADRCYMDQTNKLLAARTPARAGRWYALVRVHGGALADDPVIEAMDDPHFALLIVHEDHLEQARERGTQLGLIGVDAGCVVVADSAAVAAPGMAQRLRASEPWLNGMLWGFGCTSFTLFGDGMFKVLAVLEKKQAVVIRVNLTSDPAFDHFDSPQATRALKGLRAEEQHWHEETTRTGVSPLPYAPTETYALGEVVRHPKFGDGYVTRLVDGGKVELRFQKESRILVHGRR